MYNDYLFKIIVYCIALYLILIQNNNSINICGWIILIAHIYKDITNLKEWPDWSEIIGTILAIVLINGGIELNNLFIIFIGILKLLAHIRQYIFQDNRYYY
tara:strand:- start:16982 stop:17284 length:303 start_codon:yes stop_codon:yes gene_type:complete